MTPSTDDNTKEFIARMEKELLPFMAKHVVAIYRDRDGLPAQCGTGTLFRVADVSFLVTAAHIANLQVDQGMQLYISDGSAGAKGIALAGKLHRETDLDVAIWELPERVVQELPSRGFLTVHYADRANQRITPGWYYVHGFPYCWSDEQPERQGIVVKPFTYGTVLYEGKTSSFESYDPEVNFALTFSRENNFSTSEAEAEVPAELQGISGSSIWQAYYQGLPTNNWSIEDVMIVGVQTGLQRKGTVIRGTRWWVVNRIIEQKYPDLRAPLSIITPHARRPV